MSDIKICFNTNERWLHRTQCAVYDIIIRKNPDTNITFYIIFDEIDVGVAFDVFKSIPNIEIITETINTKKEFNYQLKNYPNYWHGAFKHIKFLLPEMKIFENVNKILYLDMDILPRKDLTELYNINLENYAIGAVKDYSHLRMSDYNVFFELGTKIDPGVLLMDLDKLRKLNFTELCKTKAKAYSGDFYLIQHVAPEYTKYIAPKYQIPYHFICTEYVFREINRWNEYCGTNYENIDELIADSFIWHYCGDKELFYNTMPFVKTTFDLSSKRFYDFLKTGEVMQWKPEDDACFYVNLN